MIQLGTYVSYDAAPDKLFFKTGKKGASDVRVSPGKHLNMRSECIDQLDKWYRLVQFRLHNILKLKMTLWQIFMYQTRCHTHHHLPLTCILCIITLQLLTISFLQLQWNLRIKDRFGTSHFVHYRLKMN